MIYLCSPLTGRRSIFVWLYAILVTVLFLLLLYVDDQTHLYDTVV
jgi:hypothetical protein